MNGHTVAVILTQARRPNLVALLVLVVAAVFVASACGSAALQSSPTISVPEVLNEEVVPGNDPTASTIVDQRSAPATVGATTAVPSTDVPTTDVPTTQAPPVATSLVLPSTTSPATTTPSSLYTGSVEEIDDLLAASMTPSSFREGCPVSLQELRLINVSYWSYDDDARTGQLIVHQDHADGIDQVFRELFDAKFPMASVDLVDVHNGSDQASMQANNTSAFNCREVAYRPGAWSNHAFGTAIDINPLVNPYVKADFVDPESGRPYADRSAGAQGMIADGDVVVQAFEKIGWSWGGYWGTAKDYQHFSANGR